MRHENLLGNEVFIKELSDINITPLGAGWYTNGDNSIKIRLWTKCSLDVWDRNDVMVFRGIIYDIDELKWVIERCFDIKY